MNKRSTQVTVVLKTTLYVSMHPVETLMTGMEPFSVIFMQLGKSSLKARGVCLCKGCRP